MANDQGVTPEHTANRKPAEANEDATTWQVSRRNMLATTAVAAGVVTTLMSRSALANVMFPSIIPPSLFPSTRTRVGLQGDVKCFLAGTRIATPTGEVDVCELSVGQLVMTVSGPARPIRAIGSRGIDRLPGGEWHPVDLPVRIRRGAIAQGVPSSDVYLSRTHCLLIDGVLVPVGCLVNGTTIAFASPVGHDRLVYYHMQLSTHDAVLASNLPCETMLPGNGAPEGNFDTLVSDFSSDELAAANVAMAPVMAYRGNRDLLASRIRSALVPIADRRAQIDIIRDRLEHRAGLAHLA